MQKSYPGIIDVYINIQYGIPVEKKNNNKNSLKLSSLDLRESSWDRGVIFNFRFNIFNYSALNSMLWVLI